MITFEYGMLVLDKNATKEDVAQINAFAEYIRNEERERFARIAKIQLDEQTADELIYLVNDYNIL
jgi:hypothetical protein